MKFLLFITMFTLLSHHTEENIGRITGTVFDATNDKPLSGIIIRHAKSEIEAPIVMDSIARGKGGFSSHMKIIKPDPGIDYKIVVIEPDSTIDYKMIVVKPNFIDIEESWFDIDR